VVNAYCELTNDGQVLLNVEGGTGILTYQWSTSDNTRDLINIRSGSYTLTVTDGSGCIETLQVNVGVQKHNCVKIPTAFSPNGDGINDAWRIRNLDVIYPNATIQVFDRWGQLVYSSNDYSDNKAWDGTTNGNNLAMDSYHFIIDFGNGEKPVVGQVTILK
jgi:gliding motility-associated-like protein